MSLLVKMFFVVIWNFKLLAGSQSTGDSYSKGSVNGMNQLNNNDHYYYLRQEVMFLSAFVHSLSRYDGLEAWQTSKSQNRRPLFDVELYLTVHKSFVSTSLNIIHRRCTFHLSYPYWTISSLYENTMSSITVTVHKLT
jgi:hypothetical protein